MVEKLPPAAPGGFWRWRATGPVRDNEHQAEADDVLLEGCALPGLAAALREVLFLAGEAVADDPDDDEMEALVLVEALVTLVEERG